jgi:hypothetical protein
MTNDARCSREITASMATGKAALSRKKTSFTKKLDFNLSKKLVKGYVLSTYTLQKVDQKHLTKF